MIRIQIILIVILILVTSTQIRNESALLTSGFLVANGPQYLTELESFKDGKTVIVFAHQDDDILWMLPFWPITHTFLLSIYPPFLQFKDLVFSFPSELHYAQRWKPIWGLGDADEFAVTFTNKCLRKMLVSLDNVKERLRPSLKESVKRVVTHNNWGEYGHYEHRLVNQAVRELAVEYKLDVYALGIYVHWPARDGPGGYIDVADQTGLPQPIQGYFDPILFYRIRQAYIDHIPYGSTPETTQRLLSWSPTLWTWSRNPGAFPAGWRPFIKLVQAGKDLTIANDEVRKLTEQPIVNACVEH